MRKRWPLVKTAASGFLLPWHSGIAPFSTLPPPPETQKDPVAAGQVPGSMQMTAAPAAALQFDAHQFGFVPRAIVHCGRV